MDMIWNQSGIMKLLESFFTLVKIRVGFFDLDGGEIMAYPLLRTEFCGMIRASASGDSACRRCDKNAFQHAAKSKGPYIYQCHAGLTEAIAPIVGSGEERIAFLMFGQVRLPENREAGRLEELRGKLEPPPLQLNSLKSAYSKLTVIKMDQLRACATILQSLASYVWLDNYIRIQNEPLSSRVKNYLDKNLDKPLSLAGIARKFGVGKTTLCKSLKRDCHLTVNELIRSLRVDKAKQLLQTGKLPIRAVAEQVGITDYNYFTKVFREETGVPPSTFRKLCEDGYLYRHPANAPGRP
jgi:AraC-like DNA-binding protein